MDMFVAAFHSKALFFAFTGLVMMMILTVAGCESFVSIAKGTTEYCSFNPLLSFYWLNKVSACVSS